MSHSENESRVVGNYLIVSTRSVQEGADNPLEDDEYAGEIHGNFSHARTQFSSIGTESGFCEARGALKLRDYRYDDIEVDDFMEEAAVLTVLETPFDKALEIVLQHWEFSDEEREDESAYRAEVHKLFGEHVMKEHNASYPKLPSDMVEAMGAKARALAEQAVLARTVGDQYAVPLSISGYYEMTLKPDLHQSILDMNESDILWVPGSLRREELDQMPYEEAMKAAFEFARQDAEVYAHWASGNVWDVDVKVYLMEWDDDLEEFIDDPEHYESEEPVWDETRSTLYGRDDTDAEIKEIEQEAEKHINELMAALPASTPGSGMSMSM